MSKPRPAPEGVTFRTAHTRDVDAISELLFHSWPDQAAPASGRARFLRENARINFENFTVAERDGRLVATAHSVPFSAWVGGAAQPLAGLAAVAVDPGERRRGTASALVRTILQRERDKGVGLSALYAFRHGFYGALGYAHAVERRAYEIEPAQLPLYDERSRAHRASGDVVPAMVACYTRTASRSSLMLDRDEAFFRARTVGPADLYKVVVDGEDGIAGYMLLQYEPRHLMRPSVRVREIIYDDETALRALLGYLAALSDQFDVVKIPLPDSARLELRMSNPRSRGEWGGGFDPVEGAHIKLGAMARLVDVAAAFRQRPDYNGATGHVRLQVDDPNLPQNEWPLDLTFDGGRLDVVEAAEPGNAMPSVKVDVATCTLLFVGMLSASEAKAMLLLDGPDDAVATLDQALAGPRPMMLDEF